MTAPSGSLGTATQAIADQPTLTAQPVQPPIPSESIKTEGIQTDPQAFSSLAPTITGEESINKEKASVADPTAGGATNGQDESKLLKGKKLAIVFGGMLLSVFLIALDQTILAPALPVIASKFEALDRVSWIASAYFLTQTALLLLYGQALTVFDRKWLFLFAIFLFEVGSLICAVSPTVDVLIFGRAFSGCGAAGIFVAVLSIVADITTLEQRPKLLGLFGAVFAVSSVIGPLLGGVFTDHVSWRWCFYINLPVGALTVAALLFILGPQPPPALPDSVLEYTHRKISRYSFGRLQLSPNSYLFRLAVLDWIGAILMLAVITCLVLPLQWGGITYPWSDGRVIGTFVGFGVLCIIFGIYEWKFAGLTTLLPLKHFKNRTQVGACLLSFFVFLSLLLATYYLPIYYEATRGRSASKAGIDILPYMIGVTLCAGISGGLVSYLGVYKWWLVFGPWLISIGAGLFFTIDDTTSSAKLIGYQIIFAAGTGFVLQNTIIAVQADCDRPEDIPQKTALVTFTQLIGGTVGLSICQSIFSQRLNHFLALYAPGAPAVVAISVEAVKTVSEDLKPGVVKAYAEALAYVFLMGIPSGIIGSLAGLLTRNVNVKGKPMEAGGV